MKKKIVLFALIMLFLLPALYSPENLGVSDVGLPSLVEPNMIEDFVISADGAESSDSITSFSETTADDTIGVVDGDNLDTFRDVTDYSYSDDCSDTARWHSTDDWDNFESSGGQLYMNFTGTGGNSIADRENNNIDITPFTPASYQMWTKFKWSSDDDTVTLVLGVWNETDNNNDQDYWILSDYSEDTWHTITGSFVDLGNATEIIIRGSGISDTKFMECWFEYIVIDSPLRVEDSSNVFSESFADVSDWVLDADGTTLTTDGDVVSIKAGNSGGDDWDTVYTNTPDLSGSSVYFELRYKMNTTDINYLYIYSYTGDYGVGDLTLQKGLPLTTSWRTLKWVSTPTTIGSIHFTIRTSVAKAGPVDFQVDYLRTGPSDEMGWSHDGSTTEGVEAFNGGSISSDGDYLSLTSDADGAIFNFTIDTTSTSSAVNPDYYQFIEVKIHSDDVGNDILLRAFFGASPSTILSRFTTTSEYIRANVRAITGTDYEVFQIFAYSSQTIRVDWVMAYSIANFTVAQAASVSEYLYVDSGVLKGYASDGVTYFSLGLDPAPSVAVATYPVWNITVNDDNPTANDDYGINFYVGGSWGTERKDTTRGDYSLSGTLTDLTIRVYSTIEISAIKFIEDATAPTVVRSSSTPNDPEDDETITLSAVITDAVEVYKVYFDAIVYPVGFSDTAYYATESSDNFWYYEFSTLQNGYYCFKIQATDGANTNSLTEYAYLTLNVREAAIIVEEITLIGAGQDFTMMSFSARINRDCTYTIYEESASSAEADTYTGSVTAPSFNIAWEKLDVDDSNVNFTITFVSGALTYNYTSQYQVSQTTFCLEYYNHNGPDWSEYVTVTGRITKTATYTVYIDDVEATTGTITGLDFDIEFSKILTSANREAWHDWAIKFTNGSQTCWANGTFYLWKNSPDQAEIGGGDLGGDERRTIQMWATIAAVIGVIGVGCIGLVYFRFDEVNKLQLPNYPTQPSTREERRRQRSK